MLLLCAPMVFAQTQPSSCCPDKAAGEKRALLWQQLERQEREVGRQTDGVMGLAIVDLTSKEEILIHADEIMPQASTIKIAVLAGLYDQANAGKLKLNDLYTVRTEDIVQDSDILGGLTPGVTRVTLRDLAAVMMAVSDNGATNVLIDRVGMENINATVHKLGLRNTKLQRKMMDLKAAGEGRENISTPREMMTLLRLIYEGKLLSPELTKDFFAMLGTHKSEGHLQKYLPDWHIVASKHGWLEGVRNDCGIFFVPGRPYIVCGMFTYLKDEKQGEESLARIGRLAFDYFDRVARASEYGRIVSPK